MGQTIALAPRRTRTTRAHLNVEALSTAALLRLHERYFGPLDAHSKQRIVETAIVNGWDRTWDLDGLAA